MSTPDQVVGAVQGISTSTQGIVDVLGRLSTGSYWSQLKPASFRGVPFQTVAGAAQFGRRLAVHEYPFRDDPWPEDLGRAAQRFQVTGFVSGDDVIAQRDAMIAAVEKAGPGELVHPTFGRLKVSVLAFEATEPAGQGRVFEYRFVVVKFADRRYPSTAIDSSGAVRDAATLFGSTAAAAWVQVTLAPLLAQANFINQQVQQAAEVATQAQQVANDATSLLRLAVSLPGQFGRLLGLAAGISVGELVRPVVDATVQGLVGAASAARDAVKTAGDNLVAAAAILTPATMPGFTAATSALVTAVLGAASTPGDAVRTLTQLAEFQPSLDGVGAGLLIQQASLDLLHRSAISAIATAASNYQPASSEDAVAIRTAVLETLDAEITRAGDAGADDVFASLRALRAKVVADLNRRGASLPSLMTVTMPTMLPSVVLAQRLYRDPTRADELVRRAAPAHPAFMPLTFQALNQ